MRNGAFFFMKQTGIVGDPMKLIASNSSNTLDLSKFIWTYKVSLNGENRRYYDPKIINEVQWEINGVAIEKPMTTFKSPKRKDFVLLDF